MSTGLDFEHPLLELEAKIQRLAALELEQDLGLGAEIRELRGRLERLRVDRFRQLAPWQKIALARHPNRPGTTDYMNAFLEDSIELFGDKAFKNDPAIRTCLGKIDGVRVLLVGHQKGKTTREKIDCNFGCPHPEGYRKALDKMRLAAKCGLPIVTLINTPGAYPGITAEERGQSHAIAVNLMEMAGLPVPIVCTVIGEGGSGGALGIGVGDVNLMLEHAYYSVISPEGCASIIFKDAARAPEAADALRLTSRDILELGIADEIVPEPLGGAHRDHGQMCAILKDVILRHVRALMSLPPDELLERRYAKLRRLGAHIDASVPV